MAPEPMPRYFFVHRSIPSHDYMPIFNPKPKRGQVVRIDDSWTIEKIMVHAGVFSSEEEARKTKYQGRLPFGAPLTRIRVVKPKAAHIQIVS